MTDAATARRRNMKKVISWLAAAVAVLFLATGCAQPIYLLASHVTKTGPDKEADDIWILHDSTLKRCTETAEGPVCVPVKDQTTGGSVRN